MKKTQSVTKKLLTHLISNYPCPMLEEKFNKTLFFFVEYGSNFRRKYSLIKKFNVILYYDTILL